MSGQKHVWDQAAEAPSTSDPLAKKRVVTKKTVEKKWIVENDKELNTSVWLKFDLANHDHMVALKCAVCSQFWARLEGMHNYRSSFIEGSTNVHMSTFNFKTMLRRACTDMLWLSTGGNQQAPFMNMRRLLPHSLIYLWTRRRERGLSISSR